MKNLTFVPYIKFFSGLALIFTISGSQNAMATEQETLCKTYISGNIAWDNDSPYKSARIWDKTNIDNLCKGTKNHKEPGDCFHDVMTGHVKWGSSDKWEWKNAIKLCAGTDNSEERIACFDKRIKAGEKWDAAIFQCQSNSGSLNNKVPG